MREGFSTPEEWLEKYTKEPCAICGSKVIHLEAVEGGRK